MTWLLFLGHIYYRTTVRAEFWLQLSQLPQQRSRRVDFYVLAHTACPSFKERRRAQPLQNFGQFAGSAPHSCHHSASSTRASRTAVSSNVKMPGYGQVLIWEPGGVASEFLQQTQNSTAFFLSSYSDCSRARTRDSFTGSPMLGRTFAAQLPYNFHFLIEHYAKTFH